MISTAILSSSYFGPIQYFQKVFTHENLIIDHFENYIKQTYRSRCDIYSPNGILTLSIPLIKRNKKQIIKDTKISYATNWQVLHWRSIESSYRRSPFFEYFEDEMRYLFFEKKYNYLIDLNIETFNLVLEMLQKEVNYSLSKEYFSKYENAIDYRNIIQPKIELSKDDTFQIKKYHQVFQEKDGFIPNLSILDLLFNQGSKSLDFIV